MINSRVNGGWSTDGLSTVGGSFWMVLVSGALFAANAAVFVSLHRKRTRRKTHASQVVIESGKPNGNLMLY